MGLKVTQKLGRPHLVEEVMLPGREIGIQIDQTLTQDATSTLVMRELEAMGLDRVRTEVSVQYVDRNPIQEDSKNPDDHLFLRSACRRFDVWFSPTGNGVSHPVQWLPKSPLGRPPEQSDAGDGRRRTRSGACDGRTALSCQDTESVGRHLQDRSRTELARKT